MGKKMFKHPKSVLIVAVILIAIIVGGIMYWFNKPTKPADRPLVNKYMDMKLTDTHNHDAAGSKYMLSKRIWDGYSVDRIILFGSLPSPEAIKSDKCAWTAYERYPDIVIPYISGFDIHDESCLTYIRNRLEMGYFGLGELVGASSYSPMASKAAWRAEDPMDGYFPQVYDIAAEYHAPVLLHIDPPEGDHIVKLEEALDSHPDTIFIFAHANAYNTIENIDRLMRTHENLYIDFFAGFTAFNPDSQLTLRDYVALAKRYPDRFMLSTDSGYDIEGGLARAYEACYLFLDELDDAAIAKKIAFGNFDAIIQAMPATKTQLEAMKSLGGAITGKYDLSSINKYEAGKVLLENNYKMKEE
jgi:hypothetical protein